MEKKNLGDLFRSYMEESDAFNKHTEHQQTQPPEDPDKVVPIKSIDSDEETLLNEDKVKTVQKFVQAVGLSIKPVLNEMKGFPFTSVQIMIKKVDAEKLEMDVKIQYD